MTPTAPRPHRRPLDPRGRYNLLTINQRVEKLRLELEMTKQQIAAAIDITPQAWSHKMRLQQSSFSISELGRLADLGTKQLGRPFIGWPFLDEQLAALLEAALARGLNGAKK